MRPTLEYRVTAWGTAAKSNFNKASKVQNQAARIIITGAIRSTPIQTLETTTGLESIKQRRDTKILCQAAKFRRLPQHPMSERMSQPTKKRLKRGSFMHQAKDLEQQSQDFHQQEPLNIPNAQKILPWQKLTGPMISCEISGINSKEEQSETVRRALALEFI